MIPPSRTHSASSGWASASVAAILLAAAACSPPPPAHSHGAGVVSTLAPGENFQKFQADDGACRSAGNGAVTGRMIAFSNGSAPGPLTDQALQGAWDAAYSACMTGRGHRVTAVVAPDF